MLLIYKFQSWIPGKGLIGTPYTSPPPAFSVSHTYAAHSHLGAFVFAASPAWNALPPEPRMSDPISHFGLNPNVTCPESSALPPYSSSQKLQPMDQTQPNTWFCTAFELGFPFFFKYLFYLFIWLCRVLVVARGLLSWGSPAPQLQHSNS